MIDLSSPFLGPTPWEFAFNPEFHDAPVDSLNTEDSMILTVAGRIMTADMYHRLPEYNDWQGLMDGKLAILGRIDLNSSFLDLVVMDAEDGYLRSTFIHRDSAQSQPEAVRHFIGLCWDRAPLIRIYETLNKRSKK
ncbi:UNVERIFIED_ORG: hypothetical protein J2X79_000559 [Arthrobacter globiformis]|nr:hypothetical protein [Arthrobacter globiformis]